MNFKEKGLSRMVDWRVAFPILRQSSLTFDNFSQRSVVAFVVSETIWVPRVPGHNSRSSRYYHHKFLDKFRFTIKLERKIHTSTLNDHESWDHDCDCGTTSRTPNTFCVLCLSLGDQKQVATTACGQCGLNCSCSCFSNNATCKKGSAKPTLT